VTGRPPETIRARGGRRAGQPFPVP
jgi:hypothetical protein